MTTTRTSPSPYQTWCGSIAPIASLADGEAWLQSGPCKTELCDTHSPPVQVGFNARKRQQ